MEIEDGMVVLLLIVAGVAGLVAIIVILARRHDRASLEEWQRFAMQRGLTFQRPIERKELRRIEGSLNRRPFAMFQVTLPGRDSESNDRVVTRMEITPRDLPDGITAYERPMGRIAKGIEKMALDFGARLGADVPDEVDIGDPAIDEQWVIRGFDADAIRSWISSPTRRDALFELSTDKHIGVIDNVIRWQGVTPNKAEEIEENLTRLEHYADRFEAP